VVTIPAGLVASALTKAREIEDESIRVKELSDIEEMKKKEKDNSK